MARDADAKITIYHIGEPAVEGEEPKGGLKPWWDLCAGPHVEHTGLLPKDAISLESIAGAYWRGDEKRPMLQRVYGTAWETRTLTPHPHPDPNPDPNPNPNPDH